MTVKVSDVGVGDFVSFEKASCGFIVLDFDVNVDGDRIFIRFIDLDPGAVPLEPRWYAYDEFEKLVSAPWFKVY